MHNVPYPSDELKRKLRELKKLETKLSMNVSNHINLSSKHRKIIWDYFFQLNHNSTEKVKYNLSDLAQMGKDELKAVINEYLSYVFYYYSRENKPLKLEDDIYSKWGLPIYMDDSEIKRELKKLAKMNHPDNGGDTAKFIEIMEKYKKL